MTNAQSKHYQETPPLSIVRALALCPRLTAPKQHGSRKRKTAFTRKFFDTHDFEFNQREGRWELVERPLVPTTTTAENELVRFARIYKQTILDEANREAIRAGTSGREYVETM